MRFLNTFLPQEYQSTIWISLTHTHAHPKKKIQLKQLESMLSFEDIKLFRSFSQVTIDGNKGLSDQAQHIREEQRQVQAAQSTWYGWWFGKRAVAPAAASSETDDADPEHEIK